MSAGGEGRDESVRAAEVLLSEAAEGRQEGRGGRDGETDRQHSAWRDMCFPSDWPAAAAAAAATAVCGMCMCVYSGVGESYGSGRERERESHTPLGEQ